jgi:integrase
MAEPIEFDIKSELYRNFITTIDSESTKKAYRYALAYFMQFIKSQNYDDLVKQEPRKIEGLMRDFIIYMREDRKFSPATISVRIAGVSHFYEMNDVILNWKKIKKIKGRLRTVIEDRPYSRQEIKKMMDMAPLRDKAVICLMASSGMRRGALPYLRLRDMERIEKYGILKFSVYKKEQESYITYCTPECTKLIDAYLKWRESLGEKFTPNTPLFRQTFDPVTQVNRPKALTEDGISRMTSRLSEDCQVRTPISTACVTRAEIMETHGFRKFFKTTCVNAGMNLLYSEYLMGHRSGLTKSYFKPTETELLEGNDKALGYAAVINELTINNEHRLEKKVDELTKKKNEIEIMESKHNEEIQAMRDKMGQIISMIQHNPKLAHVKPESLMRKGT